MRILQKAWRLFYPQYGQISRMWDTGIVPEMGHRFQKWDILCSISGTLPKNRTFLVPDLRHRSKNRTSHVPFPEHRSENRTFHVLFLEHRSENRTFHVLFLEHLSKLLFQSASKYSRFFPSHFFLKTEKKMDIFTNNIHAFTDRNSRNNNIQNL